MRYPSLIITSALAFAAVIAPTAAGASDAYYANCDAARAAGAAPLHAGEPGYRDGLDRDHDGVACEDGSESGDSTPAAVTPTTARITSPTAKAVTPTTKASSTVKPATAVKAKPAFTG